MRFAANRENRDVNQCFRALSLPFAARYPAKKNQSAEYGGKNGVTQLNKACKRGFQESPSQTVRH